MSTASIDTEIERNLLLTRAITTAAQLLSATRAAAYRAPAWAASMERVTCEAAHLAEDMLPHNNYPNDASGLWYASDPDVAGLVEIWQWSSQAAIRAGCLPITSIANRVPKKAADALIDAHNAAIALSRHAA